MSAHITTPCPYCGRKAVIKDGKTWIAHVLPWIEDVKQSGHIATVGDRYCPMSDQHRVVTGHDSMAHRKRAHQVADLAEQVRDRDPHVVWSVLTTIPADELQRLLMVALAAIDTEDKTLDEVFPWVVELPSAWHHGKAVLGRGIASLLPRPAMAVTA